MSQTIDDVSTLYLEQGKHILFSFKLNHYTNYETHDVFRCLIDTDSEDNDDIISISLLQYVTFDPMPEILPIRRTTPHSQLTQ